MTYAQTLVWHSSRSFFKHVLSTDPQNYLALTILGTDYQKKGDALTAREIYLKALAIQPDNPSVLYNVAATYIVPRDFPKVIEYAERAYQLRPDWIEPLYYLGFAYIETNQLAKAEQIYTEILKRRVNDPRALDGLAEIKKRKLAEH